VDAEPVNVYETELTAELHKIMIKSWITTTKIPHECVEGVVSSIHKKGNELKCWIYEGITLLNTAYKTFSNVICRRLLPHIEPILGNTRMDLELAEQLQTKNVP
jgi:sorting nexin-29